MNNINLTCITSEYGVRVSTRNHKVLTTENEPFSFFVVRIFLFCTERTITQYES